MNNNYGMTNFDFLASDIHILFLYQAQWLTNDQTLKIETIKGRTMGFAIK